jgi:hypothetical protein
MVPETKPLPQSAPRRICRLMSDLDIESIIRHTK